MIAELKGRAVGKFCRMLGGIGRVVQEIALDLESLKEALNSNLPPMLAACDMGKLLHLSFLSCKMDIRIAFIFQGYCEGQMK